MSPTLIEVRSPADGRVVGEVANHGAEEVRAVAADLRAAQPAWEALGPIGRSRILGNERFETTSAVANDSVRERYPCE